MTVYTKWHPRKPGWWLYKCDTCGELFGNDDELGGSTHQCYHCKRIPPCHFVGSPHGGAFRSDLQYHGEHYKF